jgi:hypothetical protein
MVPCEPSLCHIKLKGVGRTLSPVKSHGHVLAALRNESYIGALGLEADGADPTRILDFCASGGCLDHPCERIPRHNRGQGNCQNPFHIHSVGSFPLDLLRLCCALSDWYRSSFPGTRMAPLRTLILDCGNKDKKTNVRSFLAYISQALLVESI